MAVVVVSDCSPVRALHHLGMLSLFETLYGVVIVPPAVAVELRQPRAAFPPIDVHVLKGFEVRAPALPTIAGRVPADLDAGEAEAIQLALARIFHRWAAGGF